MKKLKDFKEVILERRSIRVFDADCKISHAEMLEMLNETILAPSSMNLQPWRFIVVESAENKKKLASLLGDNRSQVVSSSAVILALGDLQVGELAISPKKREATNLDLGLALMQLMGVARDHGYDTCAIGAFDERELGQAFQIDLDRYTIVTTLAIGKAAEQGDEKDRIAAEKLTIFK